MQNKEHEYLDPSLRRWAARWRAAASTPIDTALLDCVRKHVCSEVERYFGEPDSSEPNWSPHTQRAMHVEVRSSSEPPGIGRALVGADLRVLRVGCGYVFWYMRS